MENPEIFKLFMYTCMDMWSWDAEISLEGFKAQIETYISNLESHIGPEAHKRLADMGVIDNTGMSWEEQDAQTRADIEKYKELLDYLNNDNNWNI